jgi:aminoglycoside phosphotransferase (APT) family kinase protein
VKKEIDIAEVAQICGAHQIEIKELRSVTGSFGKKLFFINQDLLLRVSETSMADEQEKFGRVAALQMVPKILQSGCLEREDGALFYTLLTLLPGEDFVLAYTETSEAEQRQLGAEVARFLDALHAIRGMAYDIGPYVPMIPSFTGSWRDGHQNYWATLQQGAGQLNLKPESSRIFARAFHFLWDTKTALDFQSGPCLLHNDFHPKNILLWRGAFSGVIDWECSQFGEADYDLCHLIHWCVYPPQPGVDFRAFLRGLFAAGPGCAGVPRLAERLAIYEVEHELQQILWSGGEAEAWRVPRLAHWMDGGAADLLQETGAV